MGEEKGEKTATKRNVFLIQKNSSKTGFMCVLLLGDREPHLTRKLNPFRSFVHPRGYQEKKPLEYSEPLNV